MTQFEIYLRNAIAQGATDFSVVAGLDDANTVKLTIFAEDESCTAVTFVVRGNQMLNEADLVEPAAQRLP